MIIALLLGLLSTWLFGYASIPVWLGVVFVFQFFRDPQREISDDPRAIAAPASGKITYIAEQENPYNDSQLTRKVSIFMNVFSVHSNLIPVSGTIKNRQYFAGKFFNAALDKASLHNERNALLIETQEGHLVQAVQIAGLIARRILCYVKPQEKVAIGQRYGFIRFGSRVDLYLPLDTQLNVKLGQKVTSGNTIIGYLPESNGLLNK